MEESEYPEAVENLLELAEVMGFLLSNANADVRKSVVFCLVEIHAVVRDD